jgi:hypothetical protein
MKDGPIGIPDGGFVNYIELGSVAGDKLRHVVADHLGLVVPVDLVPGDFLSQGVLNIGSEIVEQHNANHFAGTFYYQGEEWILAKSLSESYRHRQEIDGQLRELEVNEANRHGMRVGVSEDSQSEIGRKQDRLNKVAKRLDQEIASAESLMKSRYGYKDEDFENGFDVVPNHQKENLPDKPWSDFFDTPFDEGTLHLKRPDSIRDSRIPNDSEKEFGAAKDGLAGQGTGMAERQEESPSRYSDLTAATSLSPDHAALADAFDYAGKNASKDNPIESVLDKYPELADAVAAWQEIKQDDNFRPAWGPDNRERLALAGDDIRERIAGGQLRFDGDEIGIIKSAATQRHLENDMGRC